MRMDTRAQASNQLTLTPMMQRAIRLLQLSSLEFNQEVSQLAVTNPFLEMGSELDGDSDPNAEIAADAKADAAVDAAADVGPPEAGAESIAHDESPELTAEERLQAGDWENARGSSSSTGDERDPMLSVPCQRSLREHLMSQMGCMSLTDRDRATVQVIIDALQPSGYLNESLEELADEFDSVGVEELRVALKLVQSMEPAGVGARGVGECLSLQLLAVDDDTPGRELALRIVAEHLDLLAARDFLGLQKATGCDEAQLRDATVLIRSRSPRPGADYGADEVRYVAPEVVVEKVRGKWIAAINPRVVPRLSLNQQYAGLMTGSGASPAIGQQLQEARWIIRNIEQRFATIRRVAQAIVDYQRQFFEYGEVGMKPLKLRDIAEQLGLHESTVSRVTSGKYMITPRGMLCMKQFFGSHVETAQGIQCSATAVRALIKEVIANEEPGKPLSDIKVARILDQRGIKVARRTVSKYRDSMRIPPVEIRKMGSRQPSMAA